MKLFLVESAQDLVDGGKQFAFALVRSPFCLFRGARLALLARRLGCAGVTDESERDATLDDTSPVDYNFKCLEE